MLVNENVLCMSEQARLQELYDYRILDSAPDKELDELAEIASAICDTPISLLSLVDKSRQWFKAKVNFETFETPRDSAFCQHAIQSPSEVLVVEDPLNDERFKDNPLVLGNPNIRFYAGAPLQTRNGYVLGTLCVLDNKPRTLSEAQKRALMLLANKAIDYLETRKLLIEQGENLASNSSMLIKLSEQAPGAIYQLEMKPNGKMSFPFISQGMKEVHPYFNLDELKINPELLSRLYISKTLLW